MEADMDTRHTADNLRYVAQDIADGCGGSPVAVLVAGRDWLAADPKRWGQRLMSTEPFAEMGTCAVQKCCAAGAMLHATASGIGDDDERRHAVDDVLERSGLTVAPAGNIDSAWSWVFDWNDSTGQLVENVLTTIDAAIADERAGAPRGPA